jgi:hypothetical protein
MNFSHISLQELSLLSQSMDPHVSKTADLVLVCWNQYMDRVLDRTQLISGLEQQLYDLRSLAEGTLRDMAISAVEDLIKSLGSFHDH